MTERPKAAYITGGASGIGRALTIHLLSKGWHVFIADRDLAAAQKFAGEHKASSSQGTLYSAECNTGSWESQLLAFQTALKALGGRIDFIAPIAGIGERKFVPSPSQSLAAHPDEFAKPDLSVVDVDLTGVLYTMALAIQHFRRQDAIQWDGAAGEWKGKGKIGLVASICGLYCVPGLPIYTAAKHALIGLTRSYGALLAPEGITVNAVAPNVVRTAISSGTFYDQMEKEGLLTPMEGLIQAFDEMIQGGGSAEIYECGPRGGWLKRAPNEFIDAESKRCFDLLEVRSKAMHYE